MKSSSSFFPALGHFRGEELFEILASLDGGLGNGTIKSILDYGCGFSDFLDTILAHFSSIDVLGVDPIYSSYSEFCKRKEETIKYFKDAVESGGVDLEKVNTAISIINGIEFQGDTQIRIGEIPDNQRFDRIYANFVLSHVEDVRSEINKLLKHLTPNGKICIIDRPLSIDRQESPINGQESPISRVCRIFSYREISLAL